MLLLLAVADVVTIIAVVGLVVVAFKKNYVVDIVHKNDLMDNEAEVVMQTILLLLLYLVLLLLFLILLLLLLCIS